LKKIKDYLPWLIYFVFFLGILVVNPGTHYIHLVARVIISVFNAVAFNLLYGTTGLVSFGHALFYGIGAYITGMLVKATSPEFFSPLYTSGRFWCSVCFLFYRASDAKTYRNIFTMLTLASPSLYGV
jgi:ABC-type branched-subunit amino acid transport system permease subunit